LVQVALLWSRVGSRASDIAMLRSFLVLLPLFAKVDAHGQLTLPPSRNGGSLKTGTWIPASGWYADGVRIPGAPTLPEDFITVDAARANSDWCMMNPWRSPGTAAVSSPCGGGDLDPECGKISPLYPKCKPDGKAEDGRDLPKTNRTEWRQGGTAEVAWAPTINHGGGYAYRLCPESSKSEEACFQKHHLEFADDIHIIHWTDGTEATIPAKRTTIGTFPVGSQWSMNPIPTDHGPAAFPPPCPGCSGSAGYNGLKPFSVKDRIKVPTNIAPGNYTLSWRWDCEESPQVWTNCADISITGAGPTHSEPGRLKFQPLLRHGRL
jgi:hypothetical protein